MEVEINLDQSVTARNDEVAQKILERLNSKKIFCVNLLGAPGAGKTTLIENIVDFLPKDSLAVLQGDLKSDVDKKRLEKKEIEVYQIHTHSGCHLNAHMIETALDEIKLEGKKFLIIENVGNLVCPAGVLVGQHINILVNSTTEGNDKPEKYPHIFRDSQALVLSKYDLKEAVEFDEEEYFKRLEDVSSKPLFKTNKKDTKTFRAVANFLEEKRKEKFS